MRIGILGGTFNPIHNGHLYMAFEAKETLELDRVIFVPNYIPPHKEAYERNPEDVLKMLELVLEEYEDFSISTYELEKQGLSYTYETLDYFTKIYPHDELYFIIGEDSYVNFSRWKNPEIIISLAKLVVFQRHGFDEHERLRTRTLLETHGKTPVMLDSMILEISSSDIRNRVMKNKEIRYLVPEKVRDYIYEHELYRANTVEQERSP
ncbi:nicotinate-nucleotide adenylyltransferase [Proteiniclasticum sp. C24MP]|uniref:nicotinate-nucleotide adenylyltransferase n=1 Tax=Proteiniclasticum sp. C24MP TaxID=3374101 RepID=UPI003754E369